MTLFDQLKYNTVSFLTVCCLQCDITAELTNSTVSPFKNVHLVREILRKHEKVCLRISDLKSWEYLENILKVQVGFFCFEYFAFRSGVYSSSKVTILNWAPSYYNIHFRLIYEIIYVVHYQQYMKKVRTVRNHLLNSI